MHKNKIAEPNKCSLDITYAQTLLPKKYILPHLRLKSKLTNLIDNLTQFGIIKSQNTPNKGSSITTKYNTKLFMLAKRMKMN